MENISITPKSLNRYPVDIRAIDVTEKVAVNINFEKIKVDFVLGNQAALPKSGFFNKYFNDLVKIKNLDLSEKMSLHCIMSSSLKGDDIYVYDIYCNDNFFADKDIEAILETAKTEFIKYAKPLNSEKIDYDKYLELSKDKSLLLRPRWYPAKELWDPFVKEMNTYSFAFEC